MIPCAHRGCACNVPDHTGKLVVLTGGPGAGKTAVLELVRVGLCEHVAILPEAASILFSGGFPRGTSVVAREAVQRTIVFAQHRLEELALAEGNHAVVLCDRGTLDGLAYWPGDEVSFFDAIGSTREAELARYHAVIHLRTPSADTGYNHRNAARIEDATQARALDAVVANAWRGHPRRSFVESRADFVAKAREAVELIRDALPSCCRGHALG